MAQSILNELENAGQNPRGIYQRRLPSNPSKDYYFIHRNTGVTQPVIVEYGFLDSKIDDVNQLKNNYEQLAEATVKALANYTNTLYIPPNQNIIEDNIYVVKQGDSLWSISKRYNVTVNELKNANNLTSNTLTIGQALLIPKKEDNAYDNIYIVKQGDTLYKIASQYNITVSDIKEKNNLLNNTLSIGQQLIIPKEVAKTSEYIVKKGDNLYKIANQFKVTQQELMDLNNLTSNLLSIGQILKIPSINQIYIVQSGDTLYKIANQYNTTVDELKSKNNLINNTLSIGQQLII